MKPSISSKLEIIGILNISCISTRNTLQWRGLEFLLVRQKNGAPKARETFELLFIHDRLGQKLIIVGIINFRDASFITRDELTQRESVLRGSQTL